MTKPILAVLAAAVLAPCAAAQEFNLDFDNTAATPSSAYGASSGQSGTWNALSAVVPLPAMGLTNLAGAATGVTIETRPAPQGWNGLGSYSFDNPNTSGDDEALMDDLLDCGGGFPPQPSGVELVFKGLAGKTYEVRTYCFAPDNYLPGNGGVAWKSLVTVPGALQGQIPVGVLDWPGMHVENQTFGVHVVTLAAGADLVVRVESDIAVASFASINGVQIRETAPPAVTYCTAKQNSLGCTPSVSASGQASASASSGFTLTTTMVRNQKPGLYFYSLSGRATIPFQGGTLCVATPIFRTPASSAGGSPAPANDCSGAYLLDMNAFAQGAAGGNPRPELMVVGTVANAQAWGRDQGFPAPQNTTLSDGVEWTQGP